MSSIAPFPHWRFVEHHPQAKSRDPLQSELLNQESFRPADALVRESIQNSLDARLPEVQQIRVRIYVSGDSGALPQEQAAPYFQGFWPHVKECENGGQVASVLAEGPCRFVVIEDFGTTGLTGDPAATRVPQGVANNYYYFLRAEGISKKESSNLGRWGVGKYVFPKTSGVNAFFAHTNRVGENGLGLLVGQAVLMNHSLDDKDFDPDGWWAKPGEGVQMPLTDPETIQRTTAEWNVSRSQESGLSIVIPYVDSALTGTDFLRAVIRAYFGAILAGRLTVDVEDPSGNGFTTIDSTSLLVLAENHFEGDEREKVVAEIQLLAGKGSIPEGSRFTTKMVAAGPENGWSSASIDVDTATKIRSVLETGQPVQVTVPIELKLKDDTTGTSVISQFEVLLQQNESLRQKPLFMRGGIIVSDASRFSIPGTRAICIIEDAALTKMLGDAENPAHTTWTANDKIKARYVRGGDLLTLVKTAPHKIIQLVLDAALEEQRIIFADIFAVPIDNPEAHRKRQTPSGRSRSGGKRASRNGGTSKPKATALTRVLAEASGGFSVLPTDEGRKGSLKRVDVAVGYETRRGDALAKWRKEDFDLSTFSPVIVGGTIEKQAGNLLSVAVDDAQNFSLSVVGFDTNRDLHIRARGHSK